MDGLTLLDRAAAASLDVTLVGDDLVLKGPKSCSALVDEIGRQKLEVIAKLRERSTSAEQLAWNRLAGQRWGGASPAPGISIPADGWRWEVAIWPVNRWLAWRRRCDELLTENAKLAEIQAAEQQAYRELMTTEPIPTGHPSSSHQEVKP